MADREFVRKVAIVFIIALAVLLIPSGQPVSAEGCDEGICWCFDRIPFFGGICYSCFDRPGACDVIYMGESCTIAGSGCYAIMIRG